MGLVNLFFYSICVGYLFLCTYAFYYGWTRTNNNGNNTSSDDDGFFYTSMWLDID
jgi:hypothetical protein